MGNKITSKQWTVTDYLRPSSQHYSITEKEKVRSMGSPSPASSQRNKWIYYTFWCCFFYWLILLITKKDSMDVTRQVQRNERVAYFLKQWSSHIETHPIRAKDRTGFAEMGLRTQMYARMLQYPNLAGFDSFEAKMWPFVTGMKALRSAQVKRPGASAQTSQRGIVMSLGSSELRFAMHFMQMLRTVHNSNLPVEFYYYGEDDLPLHMRQLLEKTYDNVRTIDIELLGIFDPKLTQLNRAGWAIKPFSLLATNFTEVILTDADVVFLSDPSTLFGVKGYKDTGTLFFHDRDHFRKGASDIIHQFMGDQLGLRGPSTRLKDTPFWRKKGIYEQESGVVVINKEKPTVFASLLFTAWQNTGRVREETTYRVFWGDKETYWLAFELANVPYYFDKAYAGGIQSKTLGKDQFCSEHPLHFLTEIEETRDQISSEKKSGLIATSADQRNGKGKGRPSWFNGSLLDNKNLNLELFLDGDLTWSMEGEWTFYEDSEKWCMNATETGTLRDIKVSHTFQKLREAVLEADEDFQSLQKLSLIN